MHETREFPYNYLIEDIMGSYGLLNTFYQPIKVKVNGDNWGIMLMEEQYSDSFFARNKIKEAPIFRFKSEKAEHLKTYHSDLSNINDLTKLQGILDVTPGYKKVFKKSNIPKKKTNQTLLSLAKNIHQTLVFEEKKFFNEVIKLIDIEKFAKAYAIISAFGSYHSISPNNIRYYINPYNLKLEPILRDHSPNITINNQISTQDIFYILRNNKVFKDTYKQTIINLHKDKDRILQKVKKICQPFGEICKKQFNFNQFEKNLNILKDQELVFTVKSEKDNFKNFNTKDVNNIIKNKLYLRAFTDRIRQASNLTSEKILLKNISLINDKNCQNCTLKINEIVKPSSFNNISIFRYKLDFKVEILMK